jgi:calcineurin-like phosphoesterase family protein
MHWFGSDFHLSHKMLWQKYRNQFETLQEMDDYIINAIKERLKPGDTFYFLGDLGWTKESVLGFLHDITPHINFFLIIGNHDKKFINIAKRTYPNIIIKQYLDTKIEDQFITLCHYPMLSWNKSHFGAWQIFGHHHSPLPETLCTGKQMNVCLDVIGFDKVILSWDEVKDYMSTRPDNWNKIKE